MIFGVKSGFSTVSMWFLGILLSIKKSCDILISVDYTINLYVLVTNLVENHIFFPYRIFIVCPKADSFGEIRSHFRKHLKILKFTIKLFYSLRSIFFVIFGNIIPDILQISYNNRLIRSFNILFPHQCLQFI